MFQCIGCTKQTDEDDEEKKDEEEEAPCESGTPKRKEAAKSLVAQMKDLVLKFSGAYKQLRPCTGSSSCQRGQGPDHVNIEGVQYPSMGGASSASNPTWEFRISTTPSGRSDPRFLKEITADIPPTGHISVIPRGTVLEEDVEDREWVAQVEPGINMTFISLPDRKNDLKRIRFSRDMFDKVEAQKWWGENFDRIRELYNVHKFDQQVYETPARSEDEQSDAILSRQPSLRDSPVAEWLRQDSTLRRQDRTDGITFEQGSSSQQMHAGSSSMEPARITTSSGGEHSFSSDSDMDSEYIEQDEPGVFVTIKQFPNGTKDLRRVRFSRQIFEEDAAKKWWEDNRLRIQAQYL